MRIEDWYIEQVTKKEFVIWGHVYGDVHKRFQPGEFIHTSGIKTRPVKEGDVVTTRNNTYTLGRQLKAEER